MLQGALTIHNIATNHLASSVKVETPTLHEQLLLQKEIKASLGPWEPLKRMRWCDACRWKLTLSFDQITAFQDLAETGLHFCFLTSSLKSNRMTPYHWSTPPCFELCDLHFSPLYWWPASSWLLQQLTLVLKDWPGACPNQRSTTTSMVRSDKKT